jgi:hypothetical protein
VAAALEYPAAAAFATTLSIAAIKSSRTGTISSF